ncbi:molybdopterin molybdotransferase MoeA [Nitratifractor sp.]
MRRLEPLSFCDALERAMEAVVPIRRTETVLLDRALGRILAQEIRCRKNLPSFDNSAMDGFAVQFADAGRRVRVVETILAGQKVEPRLKEGECYRIMTGAQVPADAECVVPIERCEAFDGESVTLPADLKPGANLRRKGEEQETGAVLMERGERLDPARIAMLSAQGIMSVEVYAPLSFAVLSSGNELREPWEVADDDEIYNANAFGILAWLEKFGFRAHYAGALPDDAEATRKRIGELRSYDMILSTGGISMGEADFLEEAFLSNGLEPLFHGVNVKPGRPTMMGRMGECFVAALPGNPLATLLNLFTLVLPVFFRMQGASRPYFPYVELENATPFGFKSHRSNLVLGRVEWGRFLAVRENQVSSGMLTPLMESDCVAVFGEGVEAPKEGERIKVILFDSLPSRERNEAFNLPTEGF